MLHKEDTFQGCENLTLYYQCWLPEGEPKAILLVSHGLAEHSGRYTNLVNYFIPKGYAVYAFDHRGHGRSEGVRCYVVRFAHFTKDLGTFSGIVRSKHPDARIFLIGHSLGGTVATAYTINHQTEFQGLILSGATLKVGESISPAKVNLARTLSLFLPRVGLDVIDASAISQDRAVVRAYVHDPLVYRGKISARLGAELIRMMRLLPRQMPGISLPILIMHGNEDRLSDPGGSEILYERIGSKDKTLKLYHGFYHELFNEPGRGQVFADMETWLAAHV